MDTQDYPMALDTVLLRNYKPCRRGRPCSSDVGSQSRAMVQCSAIRSLLPMLLVLAISATFGAGGARAQSNLNQDTNTTTDVDSGIAAEAEARLRELAGSEAPAVANVLVLARMLVPGEGMQILALGTRFEQVRLEFGPPLDTTTTGVGGTTNHWLYRADDGTNIILSGTDAVDEISVQGVPGSTFMTREGLTFGTNAEDIATYYGSPDNDDPENEYDYSGQGIRFGIESGRVDTITVSAPDTD